MVAPDCDVRSAAKASRCRGVQMSSVNGQGGVSAQIARAWQAMERRDWSEALRWWDAARTLSPDHAAAYAGAGNALRESGRLDEAEQLLGFAVARFPDHGPVAMAFAAVANARRDWSAAVSRWAAVR